MDGWITGVYPIRTKFGTHAQVKGRQRLGNFGRDRPSGAKWGLGGLPQSRNLCVCRMLMLMLKKTSGRPSPSSAISELSIRHI